MSKGTHCSDNLTRSSAHHCSRVNCDYISVWRVCWVGTARCKTDPYGLKPCWNCRCGGGALPSEVDLGLTTWTPTHNPPADTPVEDCIKSPGLTRQNHTSSLSKASPGPRSHPEYLHCQIQGAIQSLSSPHTEDGAKPLSHPAAATAAAAGPLSGQPSHGGWKWTRDSNRQPWGCRHHWENSDH